MVRGKPPMGLKSFLNCLMDKLMANFSSNYNSIFQLNSNCIVLTSIFVFFISCATAIATNGSFSSPAGKLQVWPYLGASGLNCSMGLGSLASEFRDPLRVNSAHTVDGHSEPILGKHWLWAPKPQRLVCNHTSVVSTPRVVLPEISHRARAVSSQWARRRTLTAF